MAFPSLSKVFFTFDFLEEAIVKHYKQRGEEHLAGLNINVSKCITIIKKYKDKRNKAKSNYYCIVKIERKI